MPSISHHLDLPVPIRAKYFGAGIMQSPEHMWHGVALGIAAADADERDARVDALEKRLAG